MRHSALLSLIWHNARRDWRHGALRLLFAALVLAVAALSSVGFLADRLQRGLERDARQLIGADLLIVADYPVPTAYADEARRQGLTTASTATFPSMATVGNRSKLAAVKAVTTGYPLRGKLRTAASIDGPDTATDALPAPSTVWIDPALAAALQIGVGDSIGLGRRTFPVGRILTEERDRGAGFFNFAPRLMLGMDDLASTGLITFGSRVTYRLLVAGPNEAVERYQTWARAQLAGTPAQAAPRGIRLESLEQGQPQMRATLDRAGHLLALVSLLAAFVSAVALAMATRQFVERRLDAVAVMKCLGLTRPRVLAVFAGEFVLVGLAAAIGGGLLGYVAHLALLAVLGDLLTTSLPLPGLTPWLIGALATLILLVGYAWPPLLALTRVPPLRVLRRDATAPSGSGLVVYGLAAASFAALLFWAAGDLKLGAITAGGFAGAILVFAAACAALLYGANAVLAMRPRHLKLDWRFALAALTRRRGATILQTVALAIGLMALVLLLITREDLLRSWRAVTPPDAPNRFIINILPEQRGDVAGALANAGIADAPLSPMIRGRLTAINARPISPADYPDGDAQRLVDREFNLSYTATLPTGNRIVDGQWHGDTARAEISIEQGIAKTLGIKLGDSLRYDIAGQTLDATVTSIRKLDWSSMRVNFFVILPPRVMAPYAKSWITAFHLPSGHPRFDAELVGRFPNLTIINSEQALAQFRSIIDKVSAAVELLFAFTLGAGVLVLYTALAASREARTRDAALLRALGASAAQLRMLQRVELVGIGAIAGLLAALGALGTGWMLAARVFEFPFGASAWTIPAGVAAGVIAALTGGALGLRGMLARPPLTYLRDE